MNDIMTMLSQLRRPAILMRAARHGTAFYTRERDQGRCTGRVGVMSPAQAVMAIILVERIRSRGDVDTIPSSLFKRCLIRVRHIGSRPLYSNMAPLRQRAREQ